MHHKGLSGAETILLALLVATGIGSSGCNAQSGWYDSMTGNHGCAAAPLAIAYWSAGVPMRSPDDYANLEAFLTKYPRSEQAVRSVLLIAPALRHDARA